MSGAVDTGQGYLERIQVDLARLGLQRVATRARDEPPIAGRLAQIRSVHGGENSVGGSLQSGNGQGDSTEPSSVVVSPATAGSGVGLGRVAASSGRDASGGSAAISPCPFSRSSPRFRCQCIAGASAGRSAALRRALGG